jgi:ABC-type glycerol-3-phosphate transport system substrate-binding protein
MKRLFIFAIAALGLVGCGTPPGSGPTEKSERITLRVLVVEDLGGLAKALQEQWNTRSSEDELEVRSTTTAELAKAERLSADVILFPARWIGELAERELIQPIPESVLQASGESEPLLRFDDLLPAVRHCDVSWGRKVYSVTLGSPQLMLLYRPDVFDRLKLQPPTTWAEYQAVAEKIADPKSLGELEPDDGQPWHATLEPTAAGWAGVTLLARAASAVRTEGQAYSLFDLDKMDARVGTPPFVQAAKEMSAAATTSGASDRRLTPAQVREAFFAGECGMAITWPSAADAKESKVPVAFAELPGRADYFSFKTDKWANKASGVDPRTTLCSAAGHLAAVTREARRSRTAFGFLAWLSSEETASVLAQTNPEAAPSTRTQLANAARWVGKGVPAEAAAQCGQAIDSSLSRTSWMPVVRLPSVDAYHAALDEAVWQSLADSEKAGNAFAQAAQQWDRITAQRGASQQRQAYQRSLGNDF